MAKVQIKTVAVMFPLPVVLVTCVDNDGKPNIITLSWTGVVCSEPPMLSISIRPHRYSYGLIKEQREFVVNIPSVDMMRQADICGTVSGKETDKFALAKFTALAAANVKTPLIKECPVNLECRLKHSLPLGTHEMFIGEVIAVHADDAVVSAGQIDVGKVRAFSYDSLGAYWRLNDKIGYYGCSKG